MQLIPVAVMAGQAIASHYAQKSAQKRSTEEKAALAGGQGAAGSLTSMGTGLYGTGTGLVTAGQANVAPAASYYGKLLSGNRALQSQAVAAPRAAISDTYRGAERGLEHGGVRGAARDQATGELQRQKAGQISSLITGVQPAAAGAQAAIGEQQTAQGGALAGMGTSATQGAGGIYANLLGQGAANRQYASKEGENFGSGMGTLLAGLLNGMMKKRGGGGVNTDWGGTSSPY